MAESRARSPFPPVSSETDSPLPRPRRSRCFRRALRDMLHFCNSAHPEIMHSIARDRFVILNHQLVEFQLLPLFYEQTTKHPQNLETLLARHGYARVRGQDELGRFRRGRFRRGRRSDGEDEHDTRGRGFGGRGPGGWTGRGRGRLGREGNDGNVPQVTINEPVREADPAERHDGGRGGRWCFRGGSDRGSVARGGGRGGGWRSLFLPSAPNLEGIDSTFSLRGSERQETSGILRWLRGTTGRGDGGGRRSFHRRDVPHRPSDDRGGADGVGTEPHRPRCLAARLRDRWVAAEPHRRCSEEIPDDLFLTEESTTSSLSGGAAIIPVLDEGIHRDTSARSGMSLSTTTSSSGCCSGGGGRHDDGTTKRLSRSDATMSTSSLKTDCSRTTLTTNASTNMPTSVTESQFEGKRTNKRKKEDVQEMETDHSVGVAAVIGAMATEDEEEEGQEFEAKMSCFFGKKPG